MADHRGLSVAVLCSAGVHAAIKVARLADLQGADTLHEDLLELGVVSDDQLVFQPLDLRLVSHTRAHRCTHAHTQVHT